MPDSIPWSVAKEVADSQNCRQIILAAWDGQNMHLVTYGASIDDSDQAAQGGNLGKRTLGWPDQLCRDESPRVVKLRDERDQLRDALADLIDSLDGSTAQVYATASKGKAILDQCTGV